MLLTIVKYGTPVLRQKGVPVEAVTPAIKKLIGDMLETMYAHKGIGLAAQQVGLPLQLTVLDVRGVTDRPSSLEIEGKPVEISDFMPMVLMNPKLKPAAEPVKGLEGCLSFPEIFSEISRPESIDVEALDKQGAVIKFRCGGLLARAIQHETDHLHGILFIDRMDKKAKQELQAELEVLQTQTKAELKK